MTNSDDDQLCVNAIRCLSADMPSAANSGHPGAPLGCAPLAHLLWTKHMNYNPANPRWFNRDRFVLSNGHSCALLYAMLHLSGYSLSLDDLRSFRRLGSRTPGHPESGETPGVEVTTGPLGQGIANAVGLAMAQKHLAACFNKEDYSLIDNRVYAIMGDGCHQEGISAEACSLAGHLKLDNLIVLYDDNNITIDGECSLSFTENVPARFRAYGWHTMEVRDGNDLSTLDACIEEAKKITDRPTLISVKTVIGFGSVEQNTHKVHGTPLKSEDLQAMKKKFGFDGNACFVVPEKVKSIYATLKDIGAQKERLWKEQLTAYKHLYPELGRELERRMSGCLPTNWKDVLPKWEGTGPAMATRQTSQKVLNALAKAIPEIVGGSADLTPSNLTYLECSHDFQSPSYDGRYFRFGVREHAMAAIVNGLSAYGGLIPFGATFLNFVQYALGAVRLSALSRVRVLYILTHDSIALGEDGPTHQPINAMAMLRAIPNLLAIRPCDGNETSGAYAIALESLTRPTVLVLSRQSCPQQSTSSADAVRRGGYILHDVDEMPKLIFVASGSEVGLCVATAKLLPFPVRVVSMPCTTLFDEQPLGYKLSLFPEGVPVISCEAMSVKGWHEYSHVQHGMTTFGASGAGPAVLDHFGFNTQTLCQKAKEVLDFYAQRPVPSLFDRPVF